MWQMAFDPSKYYVLRVCRTKCPFIHPHTMLSHTLQAVDHYFYLRVSLSGDLGKQNHRQRRSCSDRPLTKGETAVALNSSADSALLFGFGTGTVVRSWLIPLISNRRKCNCHLGLLCKRNGPFRNPATHHRRATSQSQTTGSCILSLSDAINESERLSRHAKQHEENREIEELNNDTQELVDLVKTKEKVIEELKNSLVEARNCVSAMEEEIRS
ncbi:hypothetical protein pdam_00021948 [Pocillopora damicornis]|uniref:Uncharacterized protein n=1 Tax=Pocillopora damicornis TaxID=46731 RepID=A0A3M6UWP0_POCDA|nr:hypothetical protein pdam_00021948 [Pocillopora damicornis]